MARFGAVLTAMVTPFADDGSLDLVGAAELAKWLVAHGNDGLVLTGTTGESPTLTDGERVEVWRAVREAVDVPLVTGSTSNDTRNSVELTKRATDAGVDGILAVTPYYSRPSQAGIEAHFRAIADATSLPVMLYDIPVRTGRKISTDLLLRLARDVPNIVALKDASGNPGETAHVIAEAPNGFEVYSGDDGMTLPLLAVGAVGAVGVATHWIGSAVREMVSAFAKGDSERAAEINGRMQRPLRFQSSEDAPNPVPAKAMMRALGLPVGHCRLPMGPDPDRLDQEAHQLIEAFGLPA